MKNSKYLFLLLSCTTMVLGMHIPPEIEREIAGYALTTEPLPPLTLWLLQRNREVHVTPLFYTLSHNAPVLEIVEVKSNYRKIVVTESWDNTAKIWDAQTGKEINMLRYNVLVHLVATDVKIVVTGLWYGANIRDVQTEIGSRGRKIVVTGSWDKANIWDFQTGQKPRMLLHDEAVNSVVISQDGRIVVTGSGGNGSRNYTAKIWSMPENLFTELVKLNMKQISLLRWIYAAAQRGKQLKLPNNQEIIWEYDALPDLIKHLVSDYVILPSTLKRICRRAVGTFFNVT